MAFTDLHDFHDPDLILPIGGKQYRIKSPSASEGLRIRQLFAAQIIGDETELQEIAKILGAHWVPNIKTIEVLNSMTGEPVLDETTGEPIVDEEDCGHFEGGVWSEMDADGLSWDEIMHAGRTALINTGMGRIVAEAHWMTGLTPENADAEGNPLPPKPGANRATRRASAKKKGKGTSSKAATGSTTRGRERTGPTTPAEPTTTPSPESETATAG